MKPKIWSGRFSRPAAILMEEFSSSLHFDQLLFDADIAVNKAWAMALVDADIYTSEEASKVAAALDEIHDDFDQGKLAFADSDEDIHSATERWLTERLGELGARIHTGRSRNDQVVTDLRIYLRGEMQKLRDALNSLQGIIIDLAEKQVLTVMPGYTHLRQAQPISFAHYLLALFFQMQRDKERLGEAYARCNKMPLGSGAIAGSAFTIDREKLAQALGFDVPTENSIDATSDRDFVIELSYVCAQIMLHLSRIAEDFVLWSSEAFRFIEIDEAYCTGSSMMPQKKNPDSLELVRGKTARVIGNQVRLLTLMKGAPSAYVRDLQEDKEPIFDSLAQTLNSVLIFTGVLQTLKVNDKTMGAALDPALYATDLADYLVRKGLPFRQAHRVVGQIVSFAEEQGISLDAVSLEDMRRFSTLIEKDITGLFDPIASLEKRNLFGGTGSISIERQLEMARALIKEARS
jgi:argininosuccinate lyase